MEKKLNKSQAVAITLTSLGLVLFVLSAYQYQSEVFFDLLISTRIFVVITGFSLSALLFFNKINSDKIETYFFLFCLIMQAFHGIIEGSNSISFYSFTGPWLILSSLSLRETFKSWLKFTFPIQLTGFIVPLFFKNPKYFSSIGHFIDNFSLPVSGMLVGIVLAKITSDRFEAVSSNVETQKKLNDLLAKDLNREIEMRSIIESELTLVKNEVEKAAGLKVMAEIASQVSHDIRSPLSVLNMIISQISNISEEKRILLRTSVNRINDIANTLLERSKEQVTNNSTNSFRNSEPFSGSDYKLEVELIPPLIESIVSEKRTQYRDKINIEIDSDINDSYGAFAKINIAEIKRVLSNLIVNAVESISDTNGKVELNLVLETEFLIIIIKDNGKGMPEYILNRLGEMGVTHGKEGSQSGSGLGLYHAKQTVNKCGGEFLVKSELGKGTLIMLKFPRVQAPDWFVARLILKPKQIIISLDDDSTIHGIWKERIQSLNAFQNQIEFLSFTSGLEFKTWFLKQKVFNSFFSLNSFLFLFDYELLNQKQTGLEIIEELAIEEKSILVTSRYEEGFIRSKCQSLKVKLLPKMMASLIPIELAKSKEFNTDVINNRNLNFDTRFEYIRR